MSRVARIVCSSMLVVSRLLMSCIVSEIREGTRVSAGLSKRWTNLDSFSVGPSMHKTIGRRVRGSLCVFTGKYMWCVRIEVGSRRSWE